MSLPQTGCLSSLDKHATNVYIKIFFFFIFLFYNIVFSFTSNSQASNAQHIATHEVQETIVPCKAQSKARSASTECPKITKATVESDACNGETVTLKVEVDEGIEGEDFYIKWFMNGIPIHKKGACTAGLDGIYGNADDPVSAMTYIHTLEIDDSVGSCSYEEQIFTAKLYCVATETLNLGDINNKTTGGSIAASYVYGAETCVTLDLNEIPDNAMVDHFSYQFRVTSGPPFGNSWICEAVTSVKTPISTEGPFCHEYWNGNCPDFNPNQKGITCNNGPGNGYGTALIPDPKPGLFNFGGIYSETNARGLWEVCVYDSYNDQDGGIEGVLNYAFLEVTYFLQPGVDINDSSTSIVDAVNISLPNPAATSPVTLADHPMGPNHITALRICNIPEEDVDFILPDLSKGVQEIVLLCDDVVVKYSKDGVTYNLDSIPKSNQNNQEVFYKISSTYCPSACGFQGSYYLNMVNVDSDGDGLTDEEELTGIDDPTTNLVPVSNLSDPHDSCDPYPSIATDDCDGDGLTNGEELNGADGNPNTTEDNTDPMIPDSDGDGLTDKEEVVGMDDPNTLVVAIEKSDPNNQCDPMGIDLGDDLFVQPIDCNHYAEVSIPVPYANKDMVHVMVNSFDFDGVVQNFNNNLELLLGQGEHQIVVEHQVSRCKDELNVTVACMRPRTITKVMEIGETEIIPIDTNELIGNLQGISNVCSEKSGEYVVVNIIPESYSVELESVESTMGKENEKSCIVVTDNLGFHDTTFLNILVKPTDTLVVLNNPTVEEEIHIFTGFSPNGDGINDFFKINGLSNRLNHHLDIYNRQGMLVYQSDNYKNDWNGGNLPNGTYFYVITLDDRVLSGYLQLMRN